MLVAVWTSATMGAVPAGAAAPGPPPAPPAARYLGTLGGTRSKAVAISGRLVVGDAETRDGRTRAFAYDLAAERPVMRDLGVLPGMTDSHATAVSGTVVVGTSETPGGRTRAFAYDVAARTPALRDLGSLGGFDSSATAVSGRLVVGRSTTAFGEPHAFAYDLAAPSPAMRDLGTLGGHESRATAVAGRLVVGTAMMSFGADDHAFVYDLAAPSPAMRDLGTLGGRQSRATAVAGNVVVGTASTLDGDHAFAYELGAATPAMRDLGALDRAPTSAAAVAGRLVVGASGGRAFAADLGVRPPALRDLGTVAGTSQSAAVGVDGTLVVGTSGDHGFVYDLSARSPAIRDLGPDTEATAVRGPLVVGRSGALATVWDTRVAPSTVTTLTSATNPVSLRHPAALTATVSPAVTGGTITFTDNGAPVPRCRALPVSRSRATCTVTYDRTGDHNILATYTHGRISATSPPLTQTVNAIPAFAQIQSRWSGRMNGSDPRAAWDGHIAYTEDYGRELRVVAADGSSCPGSGTDCTYEWVVDAPPTIVGAVVRGGRMFVTSRSDDAHAHLLAFDAGGRTRCPQRRCAPLWRATWPLQASDSVAPPVATDADVYVRAGTTIRAFDTRGARNCTPAGTCTPVFELQQAGASPLVISGGLALTATATDVVVHDATGRGCPGACRPLRHLRTGPRPHRPVIARGHAFVTSDTGLSAFPLAATAGCSGRPLTCAPRWTAPLAAIGPPVANEHTVFVPTGAGDIQAFATTPAAGCRGTPPTCTPRFRARFPGHVVGTDLVATPTLLIGLHHLPQPLSQAGHLGAYDARGRAGCAGAPRTCTPLWRQQLADTSVATLMAEDGLLMYSYTDWGLGVFRLPGPAPAPPRSPALRAR